MKKKKSKSKTKDIEAGGMCYDTKKTDVFVFNVFENVKILLGLIFNSIG